MSPGYVPGGLPSLGFDSLACHAYEHTTTTRWERTMARARVKITDRQAEAREEATRVLARREEARRRAERARTLRVDWTHELRFGPGTV